jgi:hypothetical protein
MKSTESIMARTVALLVLAWVAVAIPPVAAQDTTPLTEDFEIQPLDGWFLEGGSIQQAGQSSVLVFPGPGVASTPATCGQQFMLTSLLQLGNGTANLVFCISGDEQHARQYQLLIGPEEVVLLRSEGGTEERLGAGPSELIGKEWVALVVASNGGKFEVTLDGKPIINAQDTSPLPAGGFAIGCWTGSDVAFDDISLTSGFGQAAPRAAG